ncbi:hypothetical protein K3495_g7216, partial [Podosphaera aphanis]
PCSVDKKNKTLGPVVVRSENDGGPEQLRKLRAFINRDLARLNQVQRGIPPLIIPGVAFRRTSSWFP